MTPRTSDLADATDRAGWHALAEELLRGLVHELRGRAMTLGAVRQILESEAGHPDLLEELGRELTRLEEAVESTALLAATPGGGEEPLSPGDALRQVRTLCRMAGRGQDPVVVTDDGSAPPVLVDWALFRRVLLVAIDLVARSAGEPHASVALELSGAETSVDIRIGIQPGDEPDDEDAPPEDDRETASRLEALTEMVGGLSGAVSWTRRDDGALEVHLKLPSLSARRAG